MKKNALLMAILMISVFVLGVTLNTRIAVEANNKAVDVVLDYPEFRDMAKQSDETLSWWFEKFAGLGVEYVGLQEETLESLLLENKQLEVLMGWQLLQEADWREKYPSEVAVYVDNKEVSEFDVFVATKSKEVFDFIRHGFTSRYASEKLEILSQEEYYAILLKGTMRDALYRNNYTLVDMDLKLSSPRHKPHSSKLMQVGLGFDREKINTIQQSGLKVLARPYTYREWMSEEYLKVTFEDLEAYDMKPPVFIFSGGEVLGYPVADDMLTRYMIENDIKAGLIETSVQRSHINLDGIDLLVRSLNYNAVRVFSVWPYIQQRFGYYNYEAAEEIENTLYRAVTERNIRFIYFKPFKVDQLSTRYNQFIYITDYNAYEEMFHRFENRIADHGMILGRSSSLEPIRVRIAKQTLMGWGIVAAGVLLLNYLLKLNNKIKYGLLAAGLLFVPAGFVVRPMLMDKVMAMGAAIIFPSLGMVYFCNRCFQYIYREPKEERLYKQILYAVKDLVVISAISLLGGLFVAGILSHIEYLLEMDIFRGVKISQLIPMVLFIGVYIAYFGYKRKIHYNHQPVLSYRDIKTFLLEDIKIIYVLLGVIVLGVGYVYLARTGHETNIQASTMELIIRNILEENLLARPRTKEFLIAFPILMLGIYLAKNKIKSFVFLLGLVAVIGQTSIVNTFSHLRTPVYLSFIRTLYALLIGIIMGILYILVFEAGKRLFLKIRDIKILQ
ncbi:DUF5693 family protein [Natronincola ferrireducens]|uniref:Uncharacterized protein n=1 Tax=Natronincola ferrireducens TaxID=393762 RepID=A0A1G9G6L4_9FIRM|nr:DUF5693 family protein [Natronincola ferrireducens]SDK96225.1 hypothetical protein SAMN05660472_02367 [Natronincola ferrireducens]